MNERGTASVNALLGGVPFGVPDDLLLLSVFGSQARGTERPDSDLDVLFVVRTSEASCYTAVRDAITKTPGGVSKATVIPHVPETIARTANVYGTIEWGVLREDGARTLYRSPDFDVRLDADIDYDYGASRWLAMAEKQIFPKEDNSGSWPASTCFRMYVAIGSLLRANLLAAGVRFPFTRDVRSLYGLLPPERRPPLDVGAAEAIRERYEEDSDEKSWSQADVHAARGMAKQAYYFTSKVVKPIEAV